MLPFGSSLRDRVLGGLLIAGMLLMGILTHAGCAPTDAASPATPAEAVAVTADNGGDGATDEAATTSVANEEPKLPEHLLGDYARLTCPDVCRVTVKHHYDSDHPEWFAIVEVMKSFTDYVGLNDLIFSGEIEFPVYEKEEIDLVVGGDPETYNTVLQMFSSNFVFWADSWTVGGVGSSAYTWQSFHGGEVDIDAPYHYEVIRRLGPPSPNN